MHSARRRCVTMLTLCVLAALVSAQVTFSRDWSGGKRSPGVFDCGQFTRICRHFLVGMLSRDWLTDGTAPATYFIAVALHELKQEMSPDKLKHPRLESKPEDNQANSVDEK